MHLAEGDAEAALRQLVVRDEETAIGDQERACRGRALILHGKPEIAEKVVAPMRDLATDRGAEVEAWLVTAFAADAAPREDRRATASVQRAIALADEEGFSAPVHVVRPRADVPAGQPRHHPERPGTSFANQILTDLSYGAGRTDSGLAEPLTDREPMVLEHLPSMSSNAEIAEEMYVSVNTIKAHLKSLYRKLKVSSRRAAVRRARTEPNRPQRRSHG